MGDLTKRLCRPGYDLQKEQAIQEAIIEIRELRAKIERMENQEPVAKVRVHRTGGNAGLAWSVAPLNDFDSLPLMRDGDRLYALPGAQPALGAPDGWQLVPVEPTPDMLTAAILSSHAINVHRAEHCYHAMLAAAPKPEGE